MMLGPYGSLWVLKQFRHLRESVGIFPSPGSPGGVSGRGPWPLEPGLEKARTTLRGWEAGRLGLERPWNGLDSDRSAVRCFSGD